jgi:hypothetical protein
LSYYPNVYAQVNRAIKSGHLACGCCEVCGRAHIVKNGRRQIIAHHDDYNKPLDVRWLCYRCHRQWHQNNKAISYIRKDGKPLFLPLAFRLDDKYLTLIKAQAKQDGKSRAEVVRAIVRRFYDEQNGLGRSRG